MRGCVWCRLGERTCERCAPFWAGCIIWGMVLLVAHLAGCAYANQKAHWPSRGSFICVTNHTTEPLTVVARDGQGRALEIMRRVAPGERRIARWPFTNHQGMLLAGPYATMSFAPWEYDQYTWIISPASTVIQGECR